MLVVPPIGELRTAAASLGIHLAEDELPIFRAALAEQLDLLNDFAASTMDESRPPVVFPDRAGGYRPGPDEDPHNAWLWRCRVDGADDGPLAGRTFSVKDNVAVAGLPLTFGSYVFDDLVPDVDATVVTRALCAGGQLVGKNNMDGLTGRFGFGGMRGDYGRVHNPLAPQHRAGGSSSGSAAAVAAGEVDVSFGGDQLGSIRIPAAFTGTVGLKPTFGLVSHFGIGSGADLSLDHVGPIARTVEDVAAALQAVAGYDGLDPRQGRDVPASIDALTGLDDGVEGLRVGVLVEGLAGADPEVAAALDSTVDALAAAGATVSRCSVPEHDRVHLPLTALMTEGSRAVVGTGLFGLLARTYYPAGLVAATNRLWDQHADLLQPRTKLNYLVGEVSRRQYGGRLYAKAHNVRTGVIRAYDRALSDVDVLVMPTCPVVAPLYREPAAHRDVLTGSLLAQPGPALLRNTQPFDYTGHPALAVPRPTAGLPASAQLVGRFFDDPLLLRVARVLEH